MQLHFTKDVLPDSVSTDFQNLNKFNEQQFHRLIEILCQFLLEPKETERFMQHLTEFAGEHGMSAGPLRNLMKSVLLVPQGALKKNLTAEQIKDDLLTLGLNEEKAAHFAQQVPLHKFILSLLILGSEMSTVINLSLIENKIQSIIFGEINPLLFIFCNLMMNMYIKNSFCAFEVKKILSYHTRNHFISKGIFLTFL
uniref:COMM domain containing 7 n=1 Tax=Lates calcarifer TaxID=8187 RepID=A0A4W6EX20_LATCA